MECIKCKSKELEDELIDAKYVYNSYFEEDIETCTVKIKCKKCGHGWIEII